MHITTVIKNELYSISINKIIQKISTVYRSCSHILECIDLLFPPFFKTPYITHLDQHLYQVAEVSAQSASVFIMHKIIHVCTFSLRLNGDDLTRIPSASCGHCHHPDTVLPVLVQVGHTTEVHIGRSLKLTDDLQHQGPKPAHVCYILHLPGLSCNFSDISVNTCYLFFNPLKFLSISHRFVVLYKY